MPATNNPLPLAGTIPLQIGGRIYRPVPPTSTLNEYSNVANNILSSPPSNTPYSIDTTDQPPLILTSSAYLCLQPTPLSILSTSTPITTTPQTSLRTRTKPNPAIKKKKRQKKTTAATLYLSCLQCGTKSTPQWRQGPKGPKTLCNACGLRYSKSLKKRG